MALKLKRKAVLIELKPEYYAVACKNLQKVEDNRKMEMLI
jgi:predicted O-methyltransferase YrrM